MAGGDDKGFFAIQNREVESEGSRRQNNVAAYSAGYLIGTAGIHIMGILLGELLYQPEGC